MFMKLEKNMQETKTKVAIFTKEIVSIKNKTKGMPGWLSH